MYPWITLVGVLLVTGSATMSIHSRTEPQVESRFVGSLREPQYLKGAKK